MTHRILIRHLDGSKANQVEQFPIGSFKEILIGRDESAGVRFDPQQDDLVSRLHVKIFADSSSPSGFQIADLQSRNGTYVQGQRVFAPLPISHNDVIQLGTGGPRMCFELDPAPESAIKPTRELEGISVDGAAPRMVPTRQVNLDLLPGTPFSTGSLGDISGGPSRPIGRATVERILDDTFVKVKHESNKSVWVGVGVAVLIAVASIVGYELIQQNSAQTAAAAKLQQMALESVNNAVKETPAQTAAMSQQITKLQGELKKLEDRDAKNSAALGEVLASERRKTGDATPTAGQRAAAPAAANLAEAGFNEQVAKAYNFLKADQLQPAGQTAALLISQYPDHWLAYGIAGAVLQKQSKLPEAKLAYQRAVALAPPDVKPQLNDAIHAIDTQTVTDKPAAPPNSK